MGQHEGRVRARGVNTPDIAVAVIDDHDAIHAAVRFWCAQATPPIAEVDGYLSWDDFLEAETPGDDVVVVFDLEQESGRPSFAGLEQVVTRGYRVIVYSHLPSHEVILRCLEIGSVTYLVKSEGRRHLIDALRAARTNEPYIGPRMAEAMLSDESAGRPSLAPREKEVLMAWFQTESKDLVATKLSIAPTTVRTHLQRIRAKYAAVGRPAPTKTALMARAIQDGILVVDDV